MDANGKPEISRGLLARLAGTARPGDGQGPYGATKPQVNRRSSRNRRFIRSRYIDSPVVVRRERSQPQAALHGKNGASGQSEEVDTGYAQNRQLNTVDVADAARKSIHNEQSQSIDSKSSNTQNPSLVTEPIADGYAARKHDPFA